MDHAQQKAVEWYRGPCLVLAGPGAGKTTVITNRIRYLLEEHNVPGREILVITFTKAAALEMQKRFFGLCRSQNPGAMEVTFGTFHSIFLKILRCQRQYKQFQIIPAAYKKVYLEESLKKAGVSYDDSSDFFDLLQKDISTLKNTNHLKIESGLTKEEFRKVFLSYEKKKSQGMFLDFDDMLTLTCRLFKEQEEVLLKWKKRFRYILVDEAQDMNYLQFQTMELLAGKDGNIFFVGDDDQSIYGFRGADGESFLKLPEAYPAMTTMHLSTNYRCGEEIVKASKVLVSVNVNRFEKEIHAFHKGEGEVQFREFFREQEECEFILSYIRNMEEEYKMSSENQPPTLGILFRHRKDVSALIRALDASGISYTSKEKKGRFFDHFIVQDLLAYLQLAAGGKKRRDVLRILNRPVRYLSRTALEGEDVSVEKWRKYYADDPEVLRKIDIFLLQLKNLSKLSPYAALLFIRKVIGYDKFLSEEAVKSGVLRQEYFHVADQLTEMAKGFSTHREFLEEMEYRRKKEEAEEDVSSGEYAVSGQDVRFGKFKESGESIQPRVHLYTFHGSKGLEFDDVILIRVNEMNVPAKAAETKEAVEEERRMLYVAMTRAKKRLTLSYIKKNGKEELFPSRFLKEIPDYNSASS